MKTEKKSNAKIPKTGKIGNLAKNIEKETNRDIGDRSKVFDFKGCFIK